MFAANLAGVMPSKSSRPNYWRIFGSGTSWQSEYGGYLSELNTISFYEASNASGTDINLSATAFASSTRTDMPSYGPEKANDSNSSTLWTSELGLAANHYWGCQYATGKDVRSVVLYPIGNRYFAPSYALQYSSDGITWFTKSTFATANSATKQTFTNL